jgi:hypothetical protein
MHDEPVSARRARDGTSTKRTSETESLQVPRPDLVAVQDHMVTVGKRPLELDPLPGVVLRYPDEVVDERLLAIGHLRVVLDVGVPAYFSMASAVRHWLNIRS